MACDHSLGPRNLEQHIASRLRGYFLILLVPEWVMLSQICSQVGEGEIYLSTPWLNKNVLVKQAAAVGVGILGSHAHGLGDVRSRGELGESS